MLSASLGPIKQHLLYQKYLIKFEDDDISFDDVSLQVLNRRFQFKSERRLVGPHRQAESSDLWGEPTGIGAKPVVSRDQIFSEMKFENLEIQLKLLNVIMVNSIIRLVWSYSKDCIH
jgi:hypothetical protein